MSTRWSKVHGCFCECGGTMLLTQICVCVGSGSVPASGRGLALLICEQIRVWTTCLCSLGSAAHGGLQLWSTSRSSSAANLSCHTHRRYSRSGTAVHAHAPRALRDWSFTEEKLFVSLGLRVSKTNIHKHGSFRRQDTNVCSSNSRIVVFYVYYKSPEERSRPKGEFLTHQSK